MVVDGRILEIGARTAVTVPVRGVLIDGKGRYLMPALNDRHYSMALMYAQRNRATDSRMMKLVGKGDNSTRFPLSRSRMAFAAASPISTAG
jgi:imidazolonepropionase-like amidohydrolase